jgi:Holliday junction DNA helicase RuvA
MIARLKGHVDLIGAGSAIVDVGGVGYLVFCSARTLSDLRPGERVSLFVETQLREDGIFLFGFVDGEEQQWFRRLTAIQGVGGKAALAILSVAGPRELMVAIVAGDRGVLTRASGIGPKLAGRIVNELRDKIEPVAAAPGNGVPRPGRPAEDAVSALVNLGFRPVDAFGAVNAAARRLGETAGVDALIRGGLAELAPREVEP